MSAPRGVADSALETPVARSARRFDSLGDAILFAIPLILAGTVYFPITQNYFFGDDFLRFFEIRNEAFLPFLLIPRGGHLLAAYNTVFYLADTFFGTNPAPYFWLALATHLLNVGLLFSVIRICTGSAPLACFGAALWGVSPMNQNALGWFAVYGQAMVATLLLIVLRQVVRLAAGHPLRPWAPVLWCLLLLAACNSFGIGIGATLVFPLVAFLLLPASPVRTRVVVSFGVLAVVVPVLYFVLTWLTTEVYVPRTTPVFLERDPVTNLIMFSHLSGYGIATLIVGHVTSQLAYPGLLASAVIVLFVGGIVATLVTAPWPVKRQLLACLVLAAACYAIIVSGRALYFAAAGRPEAFIRPPRYHYVAPIPLAIALCIMLAHAGTVYPLRAATKHALLAGWIALAAVAYFAFGTAIHHYHHARRETTAVLSAIRTSIDAAGPQQDVSIPNRPFQSLGPIFSTRQDIFPGWAGVFVIFYPDNVVDGKRVRFVTSDREVVIVAAEGRRTASLIVAPDDG